MGMTSIKGVGSALPGDVLANWWGVGGGRLGELMLRLDNAEVETAFDLSLAACSMHWVQPSSLLFILI